ncbi:MAG: DUF1573 domain-containing protein [Alistipes sp.]|nr:DUF1573 domain-containing protein [Alistipes sp.]
MRFLSILFCVAVAALPLNAEAQGRRDGAHVKFEQTECDFGEVSRKGSNQLCVFNFVNNGTEPLVVLSVTTSCSCVKPIFLRKPIAVGEKGKIELLVDVKKMDKGIFHRVVQVRSNSVGGAVILTLKGVAKD